jgi:hypothetical protein
MSKSRAGLVHLWPSILLLAMIAGLILFAWYPYPLLQFQESRKFALLLILTAGLIGPALTWLVYKKDKRGLVFDLVVIVFVQLAAIGWGTFSLYHSRPYFMVYTVDRFEVMSIRNIDVATITDPQFLDKPLVGPILLYANMPKDEAGFQKLLQEVMFEGKPDLQFRPEFWSLYADRQELALQSSRPLTELRDARPESVKTIDKLVQNNGGDINRLAFVPALVNDGHFAAIVDSGSGEIVENLKIDPWLE